MKRFASQQAAEEKAAEINKHFKKIYRHCGIHNLPHGYDTVTHCETDYLDGHWVIRLLTTTGFLDSHYC